MTMTHAQQEALGSFEDMRTNAKELQIVRDVVKTQSKLEVEAARRGVVPSFLGPVHGFVGSVPNMVSAYVGGRLALGGAIVAADLAQFSVQVEAMLRIIEGLQKQVRPSAARCGR